MNNDYFNIIRDENLFEVSVGNNIIIIYSHHIIIIRFDNIKTNVVQSFNVCSGTFRIILITYDLITKHTNLLVYKHINNLDTR